VRAHGFERGDLVAVKSPQTRAEHNYTLGLILNPPTSKSRLYEILWLTKDSSYVKVFTEGRNLLLLSAPEGNDSRWRRWRRPE
tara:strand:+ start:96 stop:344 length:249 start_codon:yes stop_codon:yes gene_type:complete